MCVMISNDTMMRLTKHFYKIKGIFNGITRLYLHMLNKFFESTSRKNLKNVVAIAFIICFIVILHKYQKYN